MQAGQTISYLVRDKDKWITANYKETQIGNIRAGQPVEILIDTFPGHTFNPTVLRADGLGADALLAAVIPLFELDAYATPVIMMAPVPGDSLDPAVEAKYRKALNYDGEIEQMERYAFYERSKKAYAVVITGETAKYGNIILKKGVTPLS